MIYKDASELVNLIKNKNLSSVELLETFLDRIEKINPEINAVVTLDAERALQKAVLLITRSY